MRISGLLILGPKFEHDRNAFHIGSPLKCSEESPHVTKFLDSQTFLTRRWAAKGEGHYRRGKTLNCTFSASVLDPILQDFRYLHKLQCKYCRWCAQHQASPRPACFKILSDRHPSHNNYPRSITTSVEKEARTVSALVQSTLCSEVMGLSHVDM